ncbi:MAG: hypothetical protein HY516_04240 [Candidatus Aenigmarchaeota archaeon]|nr:hypothetical protein [Candidatus Aenigmarchaeota archaeon]
MVQEIRSAGKVTVIADTHETGSNVDKLIASYGAQVVVRPLEVGDYILSGRVAVERKTAEDFLNSVKDGRLFNQLTQLKINFESPVLILEGNGLFALGNMHPNSIRGVIASIVTDYKVPILPTTGVEETAAQMFWIAKREQEGLKKTVNVMGKRKAETAKEMQERIVAGLPGVSGTISKRLLKHFGSPANVFSAAKNDLMEVDGVGGKTAKDIKSILEAEYED